MRRFFKRVVAPHVRRQRYRRVCEIGAQLGVNTDQLLDLPGVEVTVVDPCIDADLEAKYRGDARVTLEIGLSLDVLPRLTRPFDCILIDGDHNWHTVIHELRVIEERSLLNAPGTIFLHDTSWPYARRDLYYEPSRIPDSERQPYAVGGVAVGCSELVRDGLNSELHHATHEGGARNGVLTAIEDYLSETDLDYRFLRLRREFGLGVLLRAPARDMRLEWRAWLHRWRS